MSNEVGYQVGIFVLCCIAGVVVALLFDVFRISRRVVRTSTVATCVEDLMFWIISALFMFALSLKFNDGEIRWYMFLGLAFGAIIYFGTFSRFVVKCSVAVISFFKKLLITIFKILLFRSLKLCITAIFQCFKLYYQIRGMCLPFCRKCCIKNLPK